MGFTREEIEEDLGEAQWLGVRSHTRMMTELWEGSRGFSDYGHFVRWRPKKEDTSNDPIPYMLAPELPDEEPIPYKLAPFASAVLPFTPTGVARRRILGMFTITPSPLPVAVSFSVQESYPTWLDTCPQCGGWIEMRWGSRRVFHRRSGVPATVKQCRDWWLATPAGSVGFGSEARA